MSADGTVLQYSADVDHFLFSSYRIHLSPGSRRSTNRSGKANAKKAAAAAAAANTNAESPIAPPPLSSPQTLEPTRIYSHHSSPPNSPPPLAQATLPATATLPLPNSRLDAASDRSSSSASPQAPYSPTHQGMPMSPQSLGMSSGNSQSYAYRSGTTTYQEQSQGAGFTYVHTTPVNTHSSHAGPNGSFPSYTNAHENYNTHSMNPQNRGNSPISLSSRHSISHISHPHSSYTQNHQSSSAGPPSPASSHSVSSHTSGPPTPTYPVFHDDGHSYHHQSHNMIPDHSGMGNAHMNSQSHHIMHHGYSSNIQNNRFDSPPPILAPIQDERHIRRDERHTQPHNTSTYIHHPQPMTTDYPYHQSLGLGHGAWKGDSGMRKNVGTALV